MSRRHSAIEKIISPDYKYNSIIVSKLINRVMLDGKKSIAEKLVYDAMESVDHQNMSKLEALETAINNVAPSVEVKSKRVGGATYQVPIPVAEKRAKFLALLWIYKAATEHKKTKAIGYAEALSRTIKESCEKTGSAFKKREDVHRQAEANKAFGSYRW